MNGNAEQCSVVKTQCVTKTEREYVLKRKGTNCICQPKCTLTDYSVVVSHSAAGNFFMDTLNREILKKTRSFVLDHYFLLNIYYSTLTITEITDKPAYLGLALLADIGGAFGLILGSTVFGVLEIFDFFIYTTLDYYQIRKTKKILIK